jgi:peptide chain release factor 2
VNYGGIFDIAGKEETLANLKKQAEDPSLWQDQAAAAALQKQSSHLEKTLTLFHHLAKNLEDLPDLLELAQEDQEIAQELDETIDNVQKEIGALELERMLGGEYDDNDALVSVNSGAGGTESQDWTQMLQRMVLRWAERSELQIEILDTQYGDEAGIKSTTFAVRGAFAYGKLKAETGVHRLVRISPFDAAKRRHTSFASIGVSPEIDDSVEIEILDEDLRIDTFRASGAGGQHVNKTDSAIRLTHAPSGIVVSCQAERSQHKNKAKALKMLRSKLFEIELQKKAEKKAKITGEKKKIEWGSQIRSYVLQPYRMVKDHRTGFEMGNADAVLDGDLDGFIEAYLLAVGSTQET